MQFMNLSLCDVSVLGKVDGRSEKMEGRREVTERQGNEKESTCHVVL